MTSHQLAIAKAKASLAAGLLRPDPLPISRDEIGNFHALLDKALLACSPTNIQNCKRWILNHIETKQRVAALANYLVALIRSLNPVGATTTSKPSGRRRALHVLYLLNDVLHHKKYNSPDPVFAEELKIFLPELFTSALYPGAVKQLSRLSNLLQLWSKRQYYNEALIKSLRETSIDATSNSATLQALNSLTERIGEHEPIVTDANDQKPSVARKQLVLPAFHGDPSLPFFDLPAANMLPHIIPNCNTPINPRLVRPIQFPQTKPTESLQNAVQDFIKSVDSMFGASNIDDVESDAVGGIWGKDGEGYYGWSRTFCEKMKEKQREMEHEEMRSVSSDGRGLSRRGSFSSEDSRNNSRERRRRSASGSWRSRSRSRSRLRGRSYRSFRSKSRGRKETQSRSRSRSLSSNRSRTRNRGRSRNRNRSRSPSRNRSPTYSPRTPSPGYSPMPESPKNAEQLQQHQSAQSNSASQGNNPSSLQGNFQALLAAYGLPQQQFPFNPNAVPSPFNMPLPPHVQTTAMIQQMIIQQQLQQYGYSPNTVPPQFHPLLQQMQNQIQSQGFGGAGMQQWPAAAIPPPMNYNVGQQSPPSSQQQPPPSQGPPRPGGGGYSY